MTCLVNAGSGKGRRYCVWSNPGANMAMWVLMYVVPFEAMVYRIGTSNGHGLVIKCM